MYRHNAFSRHSRNVMRVASFSFPWSLGRFMCQYNVNDVSGELLFIDRDLMGLSMHKRFWKLITFVLQVCFE